MHPVSDLFFLTRGRMPKFTWRVFYIFSAWNFSPFVWRAFRSVAWCSWGFFLLHRLSWPSNLVRERTIVLFVSLLVLVCHDWNYMSLLLNIVQVCSTENTLPLSFLSFLTLGDWSSFHNFALDCEASSSHHLINMKFYRCLQSQITCLPIVSNGFLIVQSQDGETEQRPVTLTCTILPGSHLKACRWLITELHPIERRNIGRRHSANVYCTNLRVLVPHRKLRLHGNAHRSWKQFVSLVRIGRTFEHPALRHFLFFGSEHACREVFSMQKQLSHQAYRSRGNLFDLWSIAKSKDRQLISLSQLLWSLAARDEDLLILNILQFWSWLPSLEIPWSQEISPDAIPKSEI